MRRLVLPVWLGTLVLAVAWLRDLPTFDDPAFTAARAFAIAAAAYLVVATVTNMALAMFRVRIRLPLVPLLVVASLATPAAAATAFASTPPPVMHRIDTPAPTTLTTTADVGGVSGDSGTTSARASTWRVQHGECFWTIARRVMAARLGRAPSNQEVAAYWRPLIEANRTRLAHPANASLLFVGQELVLP